MKLNRALTETLLIFAFNVHLLSGESHSLKYLHTGVAKGKNLKYTYVGLVDGQEIVYYDSNIRKMIPKTEWMAKNEDTDYWNSQTQNLQDHEEWFKMNIATLINHFNQSDGIHSWQWMYGCDLEDDGNMREYNEYGYDGEDFLSLDMNTLTWSAANNVAQMTMQKMEAFRYLTEYLENTCPEDLKWYIRFGRASLERKDPPEMTLFQKDSSSPVVCHATGFFPRGVEISWQKNGDNLHEDVELRETLPNQDGTFQKRSILRVSPEVLDKNKYTCVVQHSGLEKELVREMTDCRVLNTGCGTGWRRKRRSTDAESGCTQSRSHSMHYLYTAVTPGLSFPEFTVVGLVDGVQFQYYDSNIRKRIPKTEWIEKNEGEDYWDTETQKSRGSQETFKVSLATLMGRFNHSTGVHTWQVMYGCELHDDGSKRGYLQYGYDGEDFISLDLKTQTWTAAAPQAFITKHKWEATGAQAASFKNYVENTCPDWIQKYVSYGRDTLERKDPPEVTLFQKDSSSPVECHATGFFPRGVMISWQKNGEDLHENVELRETSPNQDGTFQKRSILRVSPEELDKNEYTCVVQHSGLEKDLVLKATERRVLNTGGGLVGVIVGVAVSVLLLVLIGCVAFFIWRKKKNDFKPVAASDGEASSTSSK